MCSPHRYFIVLALALVAGTMAANAATKVTVDPAISSAITTVSTALNTGNPAGLQGVFTADAVIVDEFPPFRWTGGGPTTWFSDFKGIAKQMKLTAVRAVPHAAQYYEHGAGSAYVVVPTTLSYKMAGKAAVETGAWTFTFAKTGSTWKISSMIWGKTSG